jgi:ADP-ribosylglycohydrolase
MIGAIAGDIIGSVYERNNIKTKAFELFTSSSFFTDDTVLSIAIADAILRRSDAAQMLRSYFHRYPGAGYGGLFRKWALSNSAKPYGSWGNGAAMRISAVGFAFDSLEDVLARAKEYADVTHDHPEGIKGARATAASIFLARSGKTKEQIKQFVQATFGYNLSRTVDDIRPTYRFDPSCQGTVPPALVAFLESEDFEDAIRNAVSLGGDSDTIACITGGIAHAYYGIPEDIAENAMSRLDDRLRAVANEFIATFCGAGRGMPNNGMQASA